MSPHPPDSSYPSPSANDAPCAVCGGAHTDPYVEKNGYAFRRCGACGYIFCHPRPTQQELAAFYAHTIPGAKTMGADHFPKASSRKRRGLLNAFKLIRHTWGKRVLDLGCGGGFVVGGMKTCGAREAVGIDISEGAVAYARAHFSGCTFHVGAIEDFLDGSLGTFDFVYSSEVIEHVVDVDAYMRFLDQVTAKGSLVFVTTPDIACAQVPEDVTQWNVFSPPEHIQFFTEDTLAHLFSRFGFKPVKRVPDSGGAGLKMLFRKAA